MSGWTKLFSSIVTSSLWVEDDVILRVWIAMLATADAEGVVEGSVPGFASLARVTADQMRTAVLKLTSPDPDSRTPDHEGRRIEIIEGGWRILNYRTYRERGQAKDGSRAPAMRAYRLRKRAEASVTEGNALSGATTSEPEARGERKEVSTQVHTGQPASSSGGDGAQDKRGPLDRWWLELSAAYPPHRIKHGHRAQTLFVDQFRNDPRPDAEVWSEMMEALENQKVGHEWRKKGLVPGLDKWLEEGRWKQRHAPNAPEGDAVKRPGRTGPPAPGKYDGVEEALER